VTVPVAQPANNPLVSRPLIGNIWLESVEIQVPAGHMGQTGIVIRNNGTQIVPWSATPHFIIVNNAILHYNIGVEVDTRLAVATFNTDAFVHTFYLRFFGIPMNLVNARLNPAIVPLVPVA
jgi:poly(A) polymerase Pap1